MTQQQEMTEIEEIELSIEDAKKIVTKGEMAEKLYTNPEFEALILEGFMKEEVLRMTSLMSDPNIPETFRECVKRDLHGPATLRRYLQTLVQMGRAAQNEIEGHEETIDDIREEQGTYLVHDNTSDGDEE